MSDDVYRAPVFGFLVFGAGGQRRGLDGVANEGSEGGAVDAVQVCNMLQVDVGDEIAGEHDNV